MTNPFTPTWLDRFTGADPVREFLTDGLTEPASSAIRSTLVITIVEHLHVVLADPKTSEKEAYETFVRTVSILNVFLPEGRRR